MGSPKAEDICKHDDENDDDDDDYNQNDDDDFKNLDKEERGNDGEVEKTSRDWGREVASLIISTTIMIIIKIIIKIKIIIILRGCRSSS